MSSSRSILIVEDEAIVSLDLKMLLESAGYTINRICNSSDQLFRDFDNYPRPDLILMDIHINGELDGLESSLKIKQFYDIPVIFLTAYADRNTLEKAKHSYPYGYIIKPYDKQKLLVIIEMGLNIIDLEKQVKEREELFSATFNSIADSIVITDEQNIIHYMNPAAWEMSGGKDGTGKSFSSYFPIEYTIQNKRGILIGPDGRERTLEIKTTHLPESLFRKGGTVWILSDITMPLFLESQLRESQKMEAVGRLAGGVAHDFNNLLTVIMGYCSLILDNSELMAREKTLENDVRGIQETSRKAVKLTRQLMTFSEKQIHNPKNIDLNSVINDLQGLFSRMIPDRISIKMNLTVDETVIHIDPVQMEQVIINLVLNARDAIQDRGEIAIITAVKKIDEPVNTFKGIIPEGEYIHLEITDNGSGIPEEIQTKIFEPFFTTKKGDRGIGLGLSTVYGIIQHSGCYIDMKSKLGQGTSFSFFFERVGNPLASTGHPSSARAGDMGSETVLIVESDNYVRSIMTRILKKKKYTIAEAGNAGEALLLCEKRKEPFDMIITDLFMPLISGQELVQRISVMCPGIKSLFTSTTVVEGNPYGYYIQKPFDPDDFSLLVRKCLDSN